MEAKSKRRVGWILGGALGVLWCLYLAIYGPAGATGELSRPSVTPPKVPLKADYGWSVLDLDGRTVPFESFRGKAVFLNFWGTHCPPCVEEMPAINRLAENPRLKNVAFVALAIDDDPQELRRFITERKIKIPVYMFKEIPPRVFLPPDTPDSLRTPVTFLIAPGGRIASVQDGPAQWDDPTVVELLERLSGEKTGGGADPTT
jgi:thiol-disulfide isomerase/thioredoxin